MNKKTFLTVLFALFCVAAQAIDEYQFHSGTAVIKGRVVNKPANDWNILTITSCNLFTSQEQVQSIPVAADGTFEAAISLPHSQGVWLKDIGHVFLAVSDTVEVTIDATKGEDEGGMTFSGNTTSAVINQLWPALRKQYFGDERLDIKSVSLEEIPAWKQKMVKLMDVVIADIKADRLPLPNGTNAYVKEVLGASLLAEPFESMLRTFRRHINTLMRNRVEYYDFLAEREQWLLNNPSMMLAICNSDYLVNGVGLYLFVDISFMDNSLHIDNLNTDPAEIVDYKNDFFLPHNYDATLHRTLLSIRKDTLLTKADYYRLATEYGQKNYHLKNNFMQQVTLTHEIFASLDDEERFTADHKAAAFAAVIPLITNPVVAYHAVESYRQFVISSEGRSQNASFTPEADALFDRIIAPYKGNSLYIDFWGMYCAPCKTGMLEHREKVEKMKDLPVRFLYICDERDSPREDAEQWMQKNNIKGEHIFVTHEEWQLLCQKFQFSAVPFQIAFDKDGNLVKKEYLNTYLDELIK